LSDVPVSGTPVARSVALSAGALLAARAVQFFLNLVVTIALIRYLGPSAYGDYVFVLSFIGALVVLSDFGLIKVAVREIAHGTAKEPEVVGTAIASRLVLGALLAVVVQVALVVMGARDEIRVAMAVASTWFVTEALLTIVVFFQVRIAMQFEALMSLVAYGVQTVGALWLISHGGTMTEIVVLPAVGGLVAAILGASIARARYDATLRLDLGLAPRLVLAGIPVGITVALAFVNFKLDGVMLGIMATPDQVGLYGAASKPIEYLTIASAVVLNSAFPLLARWHHEDRDLFVRAYDGVVRLLLAVAMPIPIALAFLAGPLIGALFPPEFAGSAVALQLLGIAFGFMLITAWHSFVLLAAGRQRLTLVYDAAALAVSIVLNLILIPRMGYLGTAWAAVGTSAVASAWAAIAASSIGARIDRAPLVRIAVASSAFGVALWALLAGGVASLAAAPAAFLAYAGVLLLFRVIDWDQYRSLFSGSPALTGPVSRMEAL
jgi:O-antigen/teichoic acid export membrane protein